MRFCRDEGIAESGENARKNDEGRTDGVSRIRDGSLGEEGNYAAVFGKEGAIVEIVRNREIGRTSEVEGHSMSCVDNNSAHGADSLWKC